MSDKDHASSMRFYNHCISTTLKIIKEGDKEYLDWETRKRPMRERDLVRHLNNFEKYLKSLEDEKDTTS